MNNEMNNQTYGYMTFHCLMEISSCYQYLEILCSSLKVQSHPYRMYCIQWLRSRQGNSAVERLIDHRKMRVQCLCCLKYPFSSDLSCESRHILRYLVAFSKVILFTTAIIVIYSSFSKYQMSLAHPQNPHIQETSTCLATDYRYVPLKRFTRILCDPSSPWSFNANSSFLLAVNKLIKFMVIRKNKMIQFNSRKRDHVHSSLGYMCKYSILEKKEELHINVWKWNNVARHNF